MLLATFVDTMGDVSLAAKACGSYCSGLVHSVARTWSATQ